MKLPAVFALLSGTLLSGTLALASLAACPQTLAAQAVPHAKGVAHTDQVDIAYETFGSLGNSDLALPVIAVNGGPGLSHAYMVQNDLWERVAKGRLVVLYDQRGTGASKRLQPGAAQTMDAQVADLDAVRQALGLAKVA